MATLRSSASSSAKIVAKPRYMFVGDMNGMQGAAVRVRLAPLNFISDNNRLRRFGQSL